MEKLKDALGMLQILDGETKRCTRNIAIFWMEKLKDALGMLQILDGETKR